jgi:L-asparaginase II
MSPDVSAPPPALLAEVTRGSAVESRHWGHVAVVRADGCLVYAAGDPDRLIYPRSSLKPLQALAGVRRGVAERFALTHAELAVLCASHSAEPRHRAAVAAVLARIGAAEADLYCGPHPVPHLPSRDELIRAGREPTPIYSNCSGKHTGMLALARVLSAPLQGYWEADHPVQREIRDVLRQFCDLPSGELPWGVDGCGVPTYLMPLRSLALGYARLSAPTGLPETETAAARRIATAMPAAPEMVAGEGATDTVFMRCLPGVLVCKGGAEGCHAVGLLQRGLGVAVKVEDGNPRALPAVLLSLLRRLGVLEGKLAGELAALERPAVLNTRGAVVGEVRAVV